DTIASGEGVVFSTPRWSPDGASIVAIRQVHQGQAELVVVDAASGVVGVVAAAPEWQWAMPTWHPGGERIVASLSVDGEAFNLAEIEIGTGSMRWLTDLPSGALWPTVAADE